MNDRPLTHRYRCPGAALATQPSRTPGTVTILCRACGASGRVALDVERRRTPEPRTERTPTPTGMPPGLAAYLATQPDPEPAPALDRDALLTLDAARARLTTRKETR